MENIEENRHNIIENVKVTARFQDIVANTGFQKCIVHLALSGVVERILTSEVISKKNMRMKFMDGSDSK